MTRVSDTVMLGHTAVTPGVEPNGVTVFRSIPYAKAQRWQPARLYELTGPSYQAAEWGTVPVQGPPAPFFAKRSGERTDLPCGEDCLNISIWAGDLQQKNKPILFWVYGGAYIAGYNYRKGFTPEEFAKAHPEILVVAPNYRIGILGSMNLSSLTRDPVYRTSNNLALLDLITALYWVHKYATAFGGDASKITMYGHSAGSNAISHLLTMPLAKGLFRRAICQSSFMTDLGTVEYCTSQEIGQKFLELAGADTLEAALALTPEEILAAQKQLFRYSFGGKPSKMFSPVIDGIVVQAEGFRAFVEGNFCAEQLMIGGSEGEYDQRFWEMSPDETREAVRLGNADKKVTQQDIQDYLKLFPERDEKESYMTIHNVLGLTLGGEWIARASAPHCPVYDYQFRLRSDAGEHRALHGDPTYYVFGTLMDAAAPKELSRQMMDAWAAFVKTGDPNHPGIPAWPTVSQQHTVMTIGETWQTVPEYFQRDISFWADRFEENRYFKSV